MSAAVPVAGATGFVGRAVGRRLLEAGHHVTALARPRRGRTASARVADAVGGAPDEGLATVEGDLPDAAPLAPRALACRRARGVVHRAGDTAVFPDWPAAVRAGRVVGPCARLRAPARGALRRWAPLSTASVWGRRTGLVLETDGAVRAAARAAGVHRRVPRPAIVVAPAPIPAGGPPAGLLADVIRRVAAVAPVASGGRRALRIAAAPDAPFAAAPAVGRLVDQAPGAATPAGAPA